VYVEKKRKSCWYEYLMGCMLKRESPGKEYVSEGVYCMSNREFLGKDYLRG
jgi:hypothetical protein